MLKYRNTSKVTKTIRGVTFKPGEVKDVEGYVNDPKFICIHDSIESSTKSDNDSKNKKIEGKSEVKQ